MSRQTTITVVLLLALVGVGTYAVQVRGEAQRLTANATVEPSDSPAPADTVLASSVEDLRDTVEALREDVAELRDTVDALPTAPPAAPLPTETPAPTPTATANDQEAPVTPAALNCSPYYEGGVVGCETADGTAVCGGAGGPGSCTNDVVCPDDPHWCWTNCDQTHYPRDQWYAEILAGVRDRGCPDRHADGRRECLTGYGAGLYIDGYYVSETC
jgi:cell wall-associated NlpC family hydrolase